MLYVYALLDRSPVGRLGLGIAGAPVRAVGKRAPFAIVSRVARAPDADADRLRTHDRVVRRAAAQNPAILPARFGCVVEHDAELLRLLRNRRSELAAALDRVRGREQITLRFFQRAPARAAKLSRRRKPGAPGTRYLERRVEAARRTRAALKPVLAALADLVESEHIELADAAAPGSPRLLASVYHLVPRGSARAYAAAVTRGLKGERGLRAWLSGPCPPYAFAAEPLP